MLTKKKKDMAFMTSSVSEFHGPVLQIFQSKALQLFVASVLQNIPAMNGSDA